MVKKSLYTMLLIIDDNKLGEYGASLISSFGYKVELAVGRREALQLLTQQPVDFVITSLSFEDMASQGILESLRIHNKDAELILLGERREYLNALEAGALDYVFLPLVDLELELKLQRAVRECELKREIALSGGVDKETGFGDETAFQRAYSLEIERTLRQDSSMHVVMVSVQEAIDLSDVVEILEESIRGGVDTIFSFKKREFALILAETTADQATEIIQRALLKSLERGLGLGALAIGCALCKREEGKSYSEIERDCLTKAQDAVAQSCREGGHAAVYSR